MRRLNKTTRSIVSARAPRNTASAWMAGEGPLSLPVTAAWTTQPGSAGRSESSWPLPVGVAQRGQYCLFASGRHVSKYQGGSLVSDEPRD